MHKTLTPQQRPLLQLMAIVILQESPYEEVTPTLQLMIVLTDAKTLQVAHTSHAIQVLTAILDQTANLKIVASMPMESQQVTLILTPIIFTMAQIILITL